MHLRKKILAISGSTRANSVNGHILKAIGEIYAAKAEINIFIGIDELPHFNPDFDTDTPAPSVISFRNQIQEADGVLICTPEYVYSLPGSFKNAIEWTVSTILFTAKPTALITAASSGQKAHEALILLMSTIGAKIATATSLLIQAPKIKVSREGIITDKNTLHDIQQLMDAFIDSLSGN